MDVSVCSVLPPENWSVLFPNTGNSLLTFITYLIRTWLAKCSYFIEQGNTHDATFVRIETGKEENIFQTENNASLDVQHFFPI